MPHTNTRIFNRSIALIKLLLLAAITSLPSNAAAQCTATLTTSTTGACVMTNVTLTASPAGLYDYQWFVNGQLGPLGIETWTYMGFSSGTYTFEVQITDNNNCTVISNPVTVTIYAEPYLGVTDNNLACAGSTLQLNADTTDATSVSWTGPNGFTSNLIDPIIPNFQIADIGSYTVSANNGACSIGPFTVSADTMTTVPSMTADYDNWWSSNNPGCEGEMFYLSCTLPGFTSADFLWTGPNGFTTTDGSIFNFNTTVADSGIYTLTVTGNTCTAGIITLTDTVYAGVNASPVVTATSNGPLCPGNTLDLDGTVTNGTFDWSGPNGFTSNILTNSIPNMQAINSGDYVLHAVNGMCETSVAVSGWVGANNPSIDYWADTGQIHCAGSVPYVMIFGVVDIDNPIYSITGPNGFSSSDQFTDIPITNGADSGLYYINVSGNNCSGAVIVSDTILIDVRPCVWPGDVNNDLIANNMDVLDLGLGYGNMGPSRPNATYSWNGQYMTDWGSMQFCNQEMKFADCNGNGILTASDTFGIALNYGQVHQKGVHIPQAKSAAWPELFFDMSGITLTPGAAVSIPIKLGTSTIPMVDVYGLAAEVKVTGITPDNLYISAPAGWMGNINSTMNFTKIISQTQTDWAYVRIDHTNVSGEGTIALLQFTVPPGTDYQQVQMYFDNVRIIGNTGNVITDVNIVDDTATVYPAAVATTHTIINSAAVVPNPSEGEASLQLSLIQASKLDIIVTDITGRKVWNNNINAAKGQQEIVLPSSGLATGIYTIQVRDEKGNLAKTMKWIKK